jgi:hypothetical protein
MALDEQIAAARKRIYRDGYDMSLGEISSLYEKGELVVNPEYQRLFRWDETRRTRFIESILLNVPIPPIFVFSGEGGRWELIDGLQRVSTILEFMGLLKSPEGVLQERFVCDGTDLLPALSGKYWPFGGEPADDNHLSGPQQITIRRQRLRIEILGPETDAEIKFELFQRLNTGGANLSEQEIRNCIIISINSAAYTFIQTMAANAQFLSLTNVGEERRKRQYATEMVVRFIVMRHVAYTPGMDLHEYLDKGVVDIIKRGDFDWPHEADIFSKTIAMLQDVVGSGVFRKNNRFSLAMYEFVTNGTSKLIERGDPVDAAWLKGKVDAAVDLPAMEKYSGSGVRGTQRLSGLIPEAEGYFS